MLLAPMQSSPESLLTVGPVKHVSTISSRRKRAQVQVYVQVNERYTIQPAAITYPSTAQQVSRIVEVGVTYNHQVVARSGGVRDRQIRPHAGSRF